MGGWSVGGGGTVDPLWVDFPLWVEVIGWGLPLVVGFRAECFLDCFLLLFGTTDPLEGGFVAPLCGGGTVIGLLPATVFKFEEPSRRSSRCKSPSYYSVIGFLANFQKPKCMGWKRRLGGGGGTGGALVVPTDNGY